jgi:hypothetical protein
MSIHAMQAKCPKCGSLVLYAIVMGEANDMTCPDCKHEWLLYSGCDDEETAKFKLEKKANELEIELYMGEIE